MLTRNIADSDKRPARGMGAPRLVGRLGEVRRASGVLAPTPPPRGRPSTIWGGQVQRSSAPDSTASRRSASRAVMVYRPPGRFSRRATRPKAKCAEVDAAAVALLSLRFRPGRTDRQLISGVTRTRVTVAD